MKPIIDHGYALPRRKQVYTRRERPGASFDVRRAFKAMNAGEGKKTDPSFAYPNTRVPHHVATQMGIKIRTQKLNGEGYRIWRVT